MAITGRSIPNVPRLVRGSLADDPVLTTQPPIVVDAQNRPRVATVRLFRSSTEDIIVAPAVTPQPLVAVAARPRYAGAVATLRGSLQDDPVFTTPGPVVNVQQPKARLGVATLFRSSYVDLPTPPPIVIAPARPRVSGAVIWLCGTAPDFVAAASATPAPLIVAAARPPARPAVALVARTSLEGVEPTDCEVHRPFTGTVTYASGGTVARPNTGVVEFCTCCT